MLKGRWRFFWGRWGTAGAFIAEEGDIFNIPTGMFRGFENVGTDYGMIMAVLGGDDAGGGVTWAPQVIEDAREHGLVLAETGQLYDTNKGKNLPDGVNPMPVLTQEQLKNYPEVSVDCVIRDYVARYWDLMALAAKKPAKVIGENALLKDKPGFEIEFLTRGSIADTMYQTDRPEVLMPVRGNWKLRWEGGESTLNPGDTCLINPSERRAIAPSMTGEASLYRITATDDPAGATWAG